MRDKLIDGLFNGCIKSIYLVIDGLFTCKKSMSPGFWVNTEDLGLRTEDFGLRTVVVF